MISVYWKYFLICFQFLMALAPPCLFCCYNQLIQNYMQYYAWLFHKGWSLGPVICTPEEKITILSSDDNVSKSHVRLMKMRIKLFLTMTQSHTEVNSDAELAFIQLSNLLFSRTSGADFPELVAFGEGKMAAMVLLLHQSRHCNSNHYWIIGWKDFQPVLPIFCSF